MVGRFPQLWLEVDGMPTPLRPVIVLVTADVSPPAFHPASPPKSLLDRGCCRNQQTGGIRAGQVDVPSLGMV